MKLTVLAVAIAAMACTSEAIRMRSIKQKPAPLEYCSLDEILAGNCGTCSLEDMKEGKCGAYSAEDTTAGKFQFSLVDNAKTS